jgi:hypothetical protein
MLPLAELLLGVRMGVGDLSALAKRAYVLAAVSTARKAGESARPNISRIAVETGLTRADVTRLLSQKTSRASPVRRGGARADRVLSGWWNDPQFQDDYGRPALLKLRGPLPSIVTLVERYSGTKRAAPVLDELLRAQAIRKVDNGRFQALKRTCVNVQWNPESIENLGVELRRHFEGLLHNLLLRPDSQPLFVRAIESRGLDPLQARVLLKQVTESAEILLESATDSFSRPRYAAKGRDTANSRRIAMAVHIVDESAGPSDRSIKRGRRRAARKAKGTSGVGAA